jgi:hypothetical protein
LSKILYFTSFRATIIFLEKAKASQLEMDVSDFFPFLWEKMFWFLKLFFSFVNRLMKLVLMVPRHLAQRHLAEWNVAVNLLMCSMAQFMKYFAECHR